MCVRSPKKYQITQEITEIQIVVHLTEDTVKSRSLQNFEIFLRLPQNILSFCNNREL